jgi:hypothetical protein
MDDNVKTLSQFAAQQGWEPSYVTKLKQAERLVLNSRGRVLVKESLERIDLTAGTRSDVKQRNQEKRTAAGKAATVESKSKRTGEKSGAANTPEVPEPDSQKEMIKQAQVAKALAESRRVQALADKEEMERDKLAGDLITRESVDAAFKFIGATIRALMDAFPDQVAPIIAPISNMDEVHVHLTEQCRNVLVGLGEAIERQQSEIRNSQA